MESCGEIHSVAQQNQTTMSTTHDIPEDVNQRELEKLENSIGFQIQFFCHSGADKEDTVRRIKDRAVTYAKTLLAAQESRIKELEGEIKDHEENTIAYDKRVNELVKGLTDLLKAFTQKAMGGYEDQVIEAGWDLVNEVEEKKSNQEG